MFSYRRIAWITLIVKSEFHLQFFRVTDRTQQYITEDLHFPPPLNHGCIFWPTPKCERHMERQQSDFSRGFLFSLVLWKALIRLKPWLSTTIFYSKGQIDGLQNKTIATIIWSIFLRWIYWSLKVSWIETGNSVLQAFYAQTGFVCLFFNS